MARCAASRENPGPTTGAGQGALSSPKLLSSPAIHLHQTTSYHVICPGVSTSRRRLLDCLGHSNTALYTLHVTNRSSAWKGIGWDSPCFCPLYEALSLYLISLSHIAPRCAILWWWEDLYHGTHALHTVLESGEQGLSKRRAEANAEA